MIVLNLDEICIKMINTFFISLLQIHDFKHFTNHTDDTDSFLFSISRRFGDYGDECIFFTSKQSRDDDRCASRVPSLLHSRAHTPPYRQPPSLAQTVMVPLGGIGSRFQKEGYTHPKPFVKVFGTPMINKVISSLKLAPDDALVIVYDPDFIDKSLWEPLKEAVPSLALVELPGPTRGAAETVLFGLKGLPRKLRFRPVMLVDGDCFYAEDIVSQYRAVCKKANAVFYFRDTQPKPMYSYIKMDPSGKITEVKEKVKISHYANTGCYCFMSGEQLHAQCASLIESNKTQTGALSTHTVGEYYTSGVIANMIEQGSTFLGLQVNPKLMYVLGTPAQLETYCRVHTKGGAIGRFALETRLLLKQATFDKKEGRWVALDNFPDCSGK